MVRPSHYLFLFTALFVAAGWLLSWGGLGAGDAAIGNGAAAGRGSPPVTSEVYGTVLDRLGWPVPGAEIVHGATEVSTDSKGRFRFEPPGPAALDLRISAPNHSVRWERVHPAAGEPLYVILEDYLPWLPEEEAPEPVPAGTLWAGDGFVNDTEGQTVPGASITVMETGITVRADDVGHFTISLPRASASLIARDDYGRVARGEPVRPPRDRQEGLNPVPILELVQGARLRATLRGPAGESLTGGAVMLEGVGQVRRAEAGEGGAIEIAGLLDGEYLMTVLPFRGALGFQLPVLVDGDVDLGELELLPEEELRLQVVDTAGSPQAAVHVLAEEAGMRNAHAVADHDGWVTLSGLAGGNQQFSVHSADDFQPLPVIRRDEDQLIVAVDR